VSTDLTNDKSQPGAILNRGHKAPQQRGL